VGMGSTCGALTGAAARDGARRGHMLGTVWLMFCSRSRFALRWHVREGATMAALPHRYKKASTQGEEKRCVYLDAAVFGLPNKAWVASCPKLGR